MHLPYEIFDDTHMSLEYLVDFFYFFYFDTHLGSAIPNFPL